MFPGFAAPKSGGDSYGIKIIIFDFKELIRKVTPVNAHYVPHIVASVSMEVTTVQNAHLAATRTEQGRPNVKYVLSAIFATKTYNRANLEVLIPFKISLSVNFVPLDPMLQIMPRWSARNAMWDIFVPLKAWESL